MFTVGPHTFTEADARATVRNGPVLVAQLSDGLSPEATAAAHPTLERALELTQRAADDESYPLVDRLTAVWEMWRDAAHAVRSTGALGPTVEGSVAHLATSDGGVPKQSTDWIEVGWRGVAGDRQAARQHHGRPWQALCLWSTEVIDGFVAGGDTLAPGRAGENATLSGLPWERVRPGALLQLGSVTCEVWAYAIPCPKNARWFADGDPHRMHHRRGPVSRVYAAVTEPGTIAVGDTATLAPAD